MCQIGGDEAIGLYLTEEKTVIWKDRGLIKIQLHLFDLPLEKRIFGSALI